MRLGVAMVAALTLTGPAAEIAAEASAPAIPRSAEWPNLVFLTGVEGLLPSDSSDFVAGVRAAFEPDFYLTEGTTGGAPRVSMALANRFRLVRGDAFGDEWHMSVRIDARRHPGEGASTIAGRVRPERGMSAGARSGAEPVVREDSTGNRRRPPVGDAPDSLSSLAITVAVLSPEAVGSGAHADLVVEEFSFDLPFESRAAWFSQAGRAAGLLAVEALHHRSRDLDPDTRVRIDGAVRTPVELRRSPPHR